MRRQLIAQKGYHEEELPTATTIVTKLNQLGYYPSKVAKSKPKKAIDAIFEQLSVVKTAADTDAQVVCISLDAKATIKVGDFSRGGKKRVRVKAADHDFTPSARVTPEGILAPQSDDLFLACVTYPRHQ